MIILVLAVGTVLVDGVRKSTRRRKNPYQSSEYIPEPKITGGKDSDLSDDQADWVNISVSTYPTIRLHPFISIHGFNSVSLPLPPPASDSLLFP